MSFILRISLARRRVHRVHACNTMCVCVRAYVTYNSLKPSKIVFGPMSLSLSSTTMIFIFSVAHHHFSREWYSTRDYVSFVVIVAVPWTSRYIIYHSPPIMPSPKTQVHTHGTAKTRRKPSVRNMYAFPCLFYVRHHTHSWKRDWSCRWRHWMTREKLPLTITSSTWNFRFSFTLVLVLFLAKSWVLSYVILDDYIYVYRMLDPVACVCMIWCCGGVWVTAAIWAFNIAEVRGD